MEPFSSEEGDSKSSKSQIRYNIEKGIMIIDAIEFDGSRNRGKDIYFTSNLSSKVVSNLETESSNISVKFDIPQGEYNRVDVTIHLGTSNSNPVPIVFEGTFTGGPYSDVPVRFEYGFADQITIRAKPKFGTNIVLSKDKPTTAKVIVNTEYMFRFINPGTIASADKVNINGTETILINNQRNINVFNQVANRIDKAFSIVFE
jgi:hypothetical protein